MVKRRGPFAGERRGRAPSETRCYSLGSRSGHEPSRQGRERREAMKKMLRIGALLAVLAGIGKMILGRRGGGDEEEA